MNKKAKRIISEAHYLADEIECKFEKGNDCIKSNNWLYRIVQVSGIG